VNTTPPTDRWLGSIRELVRQEVAATVPYAGLKEYVVTASNGSTVDAVPADPTRGLPPVTGIPILSGIPGAKVTPAVGSHLAIGFLDFNPAKPFVLGAFDGKVATLVTFNRDSVHRLRNHRGRAHADRGRDDSRAARDGPDPDR